MFESELNAVRQRCDRHRHLPLSNVSMYVHIKCPTLSAGYSSFPKWRQLDRGLDRTPFAKTDWVPLESPPVRSLKVRFFGRIQKRICDLRSYGFFTTKKNGRSEKGSFTMTTACPRAPREKKKTATTN